jgi:hypothetical protein
LRFINFFFLFSLSKNKIQDSLTKPILFKVFNSFSTASPTFTNSLSDLEFHQWLVGFMDGEGNFTIGLDSRNKFPRFDFKIRIAN